MGVEIVRVSLDFKHPTDEGGDALPGAHFEPLYYLDEKSKPGYQLYENVTEGTPQSPIFASVDALQAWLDAQGLDKARSAYLMEHGNAPSFVVSM